MLTDSALQAITQRLERYRHLSSGYDIEGELAGTMQSLVADIPALLADRAALQQQLEVSDELALKYRKQFEVAHSEVTRLMARLRDLEATQKT